MYSFRKKHEKTTVLVDQNLFIYFLLFLVNQFNDS